MLSPAQPHQFKESTSCEDHKTISITPNVLLLRICRPKRPARPSALGRRQQSVLGLIEHLQTTDSSRLSNPGDRLNRRCSIKSIHMYLLRINDPVGSKVCPCRSPNGLWDFGIYQVNLALTTANLGGHSGCLVV